MGMFDFLKKREKAEEKIEIKQEIQVPEPETSGEMLTDLPEFPTMAEEDISPLPKLEPLSELEKSEIRIPSLGETYVERPVIHPEKNIMLKFDDLKKKFEEQEIGKEIELPSEVEEPEIEKEIEFPPELGGEFEEPISREEFEPLVSLNEEAEIDLIKKVGGFAQMLIHCSKQLEPFGLVRYLQELAIVFHRFYDQCRVLTDDEALSQERLALAKATQLVLANGLKLLGVSAPEKM